MKYRNPVIRGFHPDPSICRVDKDYYLVTSSFEYFPGVPVFHSRDLVNWRRIGHCLTRTSQLDIRDIACSGGIWAPSIRYHDGRFYMVTTLVRKDPWLTRSFFVTGEDPAGEWSEPVLLDDGGIDPDLFFDEDGTAYYLRNGPNGIWLGEVNTETGELREEMQHIWPGTGGPYAEAPHLYRINGLYYLMIAEGGTGYGHMVTLARSESPYGPYLNCPRNPILTHRNRFPHPIQCIGHGDLVQAHDGSWWIVFLAVRLQRPSIHSFHLGRETFLAPVQWDADGWPIVNGNGTVEPEMDADCLPPHPWPDEPDRDDFEADRPAPCWNALRVPLSDHATLGDRIGWLRLDGNQYSLDDAGPVAFVGRRQREMGSRARTLMEFDPADDSEEAGLTAFMCDRFHYEIAVTSIEGKRHIVVRRRVNDLRASVHSQPIPAGPVQMEIEADEDTYTFRYAVGEGNKTEAATADVALISNELAGTFTGVYLAMYATGNGRACRAPAWFDWFELVDGGRS